MSSYPFAQAPDWNKGDGLLPAVIQNQHTGQVLMLGYFNEASLQHTLETGHVTFYSRSKQRLWTKGESSGNVLKLVSIHLDCDQDTFLVMAEPIGPTCHLGNPSCWADDPKPSIGFVQELAAVIASRKQDSAETSYTARLFDKGIKRISQKVGEEGVETALAATSGDWHELTNESADLLYHLLVLLEASETSLEDVLNVLKQRHQA